jgi:2,5-diketo-D-gluconate reductase B
MLLKTDLLEMPALGLGTWPMKGAECQRAVEGAIGLGYRHIDTAEMYGNEEAVGAAVRGSGLPRGEVFLTTKVWNDKTDGPQLRDAFARCLERLGTGYVDLLLIHWPSRDMNLPSLLEGLAEAKERGLARAVGVSNFPPGMLTRALDLAVAPIACLQVEHHVALDQSRLLAITQPRGIALTSYTPLGKATGLLDHPVLREIAARRGATPAQVALAALLRHPLVAAVPKAAGAERQRENLGALGVGLTEEDTAALATLPKDRRFVNPDFAPDWAA